MNRCVVVVVAAVVLLIVETDVAAAVVELPVVRLAVVELARLVVAFVDIPGDKKFQKKEKERKKRYE